MQDIGHDNPIKRFPLQSTEIPAKEGNIITLLDGTLSYPDPIFVDIYAQDTPVGTLEGQEIG
jgi:hypothetical protein